MRWEVMSSFLFRILDTGYAGLEPHAPVWVKVTGLRSMLTHCIFKCSQIQVFWGQGWVTEVALDRLSSVCP